LLRECLASSDSWLSSVTTRIRAYERRAAREIRLSRPFSFIRTFTVGLGIAPNLLALLQARKALAGLGFVAFTAGGEFHPALRTIVRPV
jgi:hypothetical protein